MVSIEHILPQVGFVNLRLYEPAGAFYLKAKEEGEVNRLKSLMHLGALSLKVEGARFSRWDYTVAMLYYIDSMDVKGFNSKFKISEVSFTSAKAALQLLCISWNIGHLPGTFSTERGLYNYMNEVGVGKDFHWPFESEEIVKFIMRMAYDRLENEGYYYISKVLAVRKVFSWCDSVDDDLFNIAKDFISPVMLDYTFLYSSKQWSKIIESFRMVRHLAYLTLDSQFSGDGWLPSIPMFFSAQQQRCLGDVFKLSSKISEYLSPIELNIYERLYHSERARDFSAVFSKGCYESLKDYVNITNFIDDLVVRPDISEKIQGKIADISKPHKVISLKFRSHYSDLKSLAKVEKDLRDKGFDLSATYKYHAWNSDEIMEPDEYIIDVLKSTEVTGFDLAKILIWVIDTLDCTALDHKDHYAISVKSSIEGIYKEILQKFLSRILGDVTVNLESWPLRDFNRFPDVFLKNNSGVVWSSPADINDKIIKHIVREVEVDIDQYQKDQYKELIGLKEFRNYQKKAMKSRKLKCRWLFFTSSVVVVRNGYNIMEFDGGAIKVTARGNEIIFYGMETKNGNENPSSSLKKKLERHNVKHEIVSMTPSHSFCEIK